jgi:nucleoside-diphosphate-sugar epimerase
LDLQDSTALSQLVRKIEPNIVFHFGGEVTAAPNPELISPTFQTHLASTVTLLQTVAELGCQRLVLTGSLTEPIPTGEEPIPTSPYAAAKWAATSYARMCHKLYGTPVVIVRPYMTYGPRQRRTKLVPYVIGALLRSERPELSDGQWQADWIYVDDVIDAILQGAQRGNAIGRTIDLGTGTLTSTRTVVTKLVERLNPDIQPVYGAISNRPAEPLRVANTAEATQWLEWSAKTPLEIGLAKTIEWYRANDESCARE